MTGWWEHWWSVPVAVVGGLVLLWAVAVAALWAVAPGQATLGAAARLVPDLVRLVRRLAADPTLPRGVRVRLWLLLAYLVSPIDLVPDFVPVLGWADDLVLVALVLRSVLRTAGTEAVTRHWPGTDDGLRAVLALARMR
ncbi:MAG: DUF1232 domain-containing protein [Actinomycetales bacterium]|nr:DUF1232 domain-containing protein [Actinomycetales bacterium]